MQPIREWMTEHVHSVKPLDSIAHARGVMQAHRVNQLPVVRDGLLLGIITDRDLRDAYPSVFEEAAHDMRSETDEEWSPAKVTVESVMSSPAHTIDATATMADAARVMRRERVGALPVVEGKRLVGLVTRSDVLDAYVAREERTKKPA